MIQIKGEVTSGFGRGAKFVAMPPYRNSIKHVLGFNPYPGTLNLKLQDQKDKQSLLQLFKTEHARRIRGFNYNEKDYGGIILLPVEVQGIIGGIVAPDRTSHSDTIELVAPVMLRESLNLEDGSKVIVRESELYKQYSRRENKELLMELQRYKYIHGEWPRKDAFHVPFLSEDELQARLNGFLRDNLITIETGFLKLTPFGKSFFTIALTGGVYDLLHIGHFHTLKKAKNFADFLLVVLARDSTVMKTKKRKPINSEQERVKMMQLIRIVDAAVLGNPTNFLSIINDILPDVIVLGKDQSMDENWIIDYVDAQGFPFINVYRLDSEIENHSTTAIIERIKAMLQNEPK